MESASPNDAAAADRYRKYLNRMKAIADFEIDLVEQEERLPGSEDPASIRSAIKWPHISRDMAAKAAEGYTISFRRDIDPDVPWVAYAWDSNRLGPLQTDEVDWEAHLSIARSWLDECSKFHEKCPQHHLTVLPTRVLDVGPSNGSIEPRLFETKGFLGRYVALSYCWGRGQALTTTNSNIGERKSQIPLSECPATIQDAIRACRELSCRYLWIDALCIIQDSATDWEYEASRMQSVYKDAWVTIIAEAADSTECGFLRGRNTELWGQKSPLKTRGWALQENILTPRRLTYHHDCLSFECQSIIDETDLLASCRNLETLSQNESYDTWQKVIRQYSSRYLTKEKDIFPALLGLAKAFQERNRDSYVAGLWKTQLLPGLLWTSEDNRNHRPLLRRYRAPSWSWASYNGRVSYLSGNKGSKSHYLAKVLEVKLLIADKKDPFGQVTYGSIEIRSLLTEGRVCRKAGPDASESCSEWDQLLEREEPSWGFYTANYPTEAESPLPDVFLDNNTSDIGELPEAAFLLLIRTDEEWDGECNDRGLVLQTSPQKQNRYLRVGTFVMPTKNRDAYFQGSPQPIVLV